MLSYVTGKTVETDDCEQDKEIETLESKLVQLHVADNESRSDPLYPSIYVIVKNKAGSSIKMLMREFDWLLSWQTVPREGITGGIGCVQYSPNDKTRYLIFTAYWETGQNEEKIILDLDEFLQLKNAHRDMMAMTEKTCKVLKQHDTLSSDAKWQIWDFVYFVLDLYVCILASCYNKNHFEDGADMNSRRRCVSVMANFINSSNVVYDVLKENGIIVDDVTTPLLRNFTFENVLNHVINCVLHYEVPTYLDRFLETRAFARMHKLQADCTALNFS